MNATVFKGTAIGFVAGFLAQIISGVAIGLLIAFVFWGNEELRLSGGFMAILSPLMILAPRALFSLLVAFAFALIAPNIKKAVYGSLLVNAGVALIFGLYTMRLLGPPLGV